MTNLQLTSFSTVKKVESIPLSLLLFNILNKSPSQNRGDTTKLDFSDQTDGKVYRRFNRRARWQFYHLEIQQTSGRKGRRNNTILLSLR